jgi:hypothetical protein
VKERIYSKGPNTADTGRKTCIHPDYFGSFCGKPIENRKEEDALHFLFP